MRLTRFWQFLLCCCLLLSATAAAADTLVVVVRHAEKATDDPRDPSLSEAGQQRALALAKVLAQFELQAVYVTPFKRTQLTAAPAASAAKVQPVVLTAGTDVSAETKQLAARIREHHQGQAVLVVGHSNTIGAIVDALGGGTQPSVADDEFDRLYVLSVPASGSTRLLISRY